MHCHNALIAAQHIPQTHTCDTLPPRSPGKRDAANAMTLLQVARNTWAGEVQRNRTTLKAPRGSALARSRRCRELHRRDRHSTGPRRVWLAVPVHTQEGRGGAAGGREGWGGGGQRAGWVAAWVGAGAGTRGPARRPWCQKGDAHLREALTVTTWSASPPPFPHTYPPTPVSTHVPACSLCSTAAATFTCCGPMTRMVGALEGDTYTMSPGDGSGDTAYGGISTRANTGTSGCRGGRQVGGSGEHRRGCCGRGCGGGGGLGLGGGGGYRWWVGGEVVGMGSGVTDGRAGQTQALKAREGADTSRSGGDGGGGAEGVRALTSRTHAARHATLPPSNPPNPPPPHTKQQQNRQRTHAI
jgi:hypothetical protein